MNILSRIKHWLGGQVNPTTHGGLPVTWPIQWWQKDYKPLASGDSAIKFACVMAYAHTGASLPVRHFRINENGTREEIKTSAAYRVLNRPNDYQTRSDFMLGLYWSLMEYGNAYAIVYRNERFEIDTIHPMAPRQCNPYIDPETRSIFYAIGGSPLTGDIDAMVPARDVLHIRLHCPRHPLKGVSPVEFAAHAMGIEGAINNSQEAHFSNFSRSVGMLGTDEALSADELRQLRAAWENQTTGPNQGGTPILSRGLKFYSMQPNATDAQLIESLRMSHEDIARAYRVPLPLVGDLRNATFNNGETLMRFWLSTSLGFVVDHVEQALQRLFNLPRNEKIDFDVDYLLRMDAVSRVDYLTKGIAGGLFSPDEARSKEYLAPTEGGDDIFMQRQNTPVSLLAELAAAELANKRQPPPPVETLEDAEDKAYLAIRKAMAS